MEWKYSQSDFYSGFYWSLGLLFSDRISGPFTSDGLLNSPEDSRLPHLSTIMAPKHNAFDQDNQGQGIKGVPAESRMTKVVENNSNYDRTSRWFHLQARIGETRRNADTGAEEERPASSKWVPSVSLQSSVMLTRLRVVLVVSKHKLAGRNTATALGKSQPRMHKTIQGKRAFATGTREPQAE